MNCCQYRLFWRRLRLEQYRRRQVLKTNQRLLGKKEVALKGLIIALKVLKGQDKALMTSPISLHVVEEEFW